MKQFNLRHLMLAILATGLITACGGGGGSNDTDTNDTSGSGGGYGDSSGDSSSSFPSQTAAPSMTVVNDNGTLLLAETGLSLYTFDNDTDNTSNCNGTADDTTTCAGVWPPLLATDDAAATAKFTLITRSDGTMQWAYDMQPLYTYIQDSSQGDVTGDGVNGVWHLARPMPLKIADVDGLASYVANQTVQTASDSSGTLSPFRADKEGFTLYTFDEDPINASSCAGTCITAWPPLLADNGAKTTSPLSLVDVNGGLRQWAHRGKPLYLYIGDNAAGDNTGDEVDGTWQTATLEPATFRTVSDNRYLSATGSVEVLMSNDGSNTDFSVMTMDKDGFALYTFDIDTANTSNCTGDCLVAWPAFVPSATDEAIGDFTIFTRADGSMQWAHKGMPVYFYAGDTERSHINGDNVGGVWHLIKP